MIFRRSSTARCKNIKKRKSSLIPWKELERLRRWQPKGPPLPPKCSHRFSKFGCSSLDRAEVESFHRKFYFTRSRATQDAFILRHCQGRSPRRSSLSAVRKRRITADYFVPVKGSKVQVCKTAFLGILRVQRHRVDTVVRISKGQGNQVALFQSSLSVQQRSLPTNVTRSQESATHKTKSIFSRFCTGPKSEERTLANSISNDVEIRLCQNKNFKSRRSALKKEICKRRQSTNVDNSPEYLSNVEEVEELKVSHTEIHYLTNALKTDDHNSIGIIKDGGISEGKVIEKRLRFRDTVQLIELHNQEHSSLENFPETSQITASEEQMHQNSPLAEICTPWDQKEDWDWLNPSLKSQRSRTFDWSPLKRLALKHDVAPEEKRSPHLKILSEEHSHGLVYESKKRKLTKLLRTVEDKENFTQGKSKLKKNKKVGIPILVKKDIEKNSLLKKNGIKLEPKTRVPLQTLQYFQNQKFIKEKTRLKENFKYSLLK